MAITLKITAVKKKWSQSNNVRFRYFENSGRYVVIGCKIHSYCYIITVGFKTIFNCRYITAMIIFLNHYYFFSILSLQIGFAMVSQVLFIMVEMVSFRSYCVKS